MRVRLAVAALAMVSSYMFKQTGSRDPPNKHGHTFYQSHITHPSQQSANLVPTSNLVCIKNVAIRTTSSHKINIAGIIYYTCS